MAFRSVLFPNAADGLAGVGNPDTPSFFTALNLDQIIDAVAAGR